MTTVIGTPGNDVLTGTSGNDVIDGHGGADFINGGPGTDVAVFADSSSNFLIQTLDGITHVRALSGASTEYYKPSSTVGTITDAVLINTEQLQFSDGIVNINTSAPGTVIAGPQGQAAQVNGTFGNDIIDISGNTQSVNGGSGMDTVVVFDFIQNYVVTTLSQGVTHLHALATANPQYQNGVGADVVLQNVEKIQFLDGSITIDTVPPAVTSFSPTQSSTGVSLNSTISVVFSEAVQFGSGLVTIHSGSATGPVVDQFDVTASSQLSISGSTLAITPTHSFSPGTTYFVSIASGAIDDLSGNPYAGESTYNFTTATSITPVGNPSGAFNTIVGTSGNDTIYSTSANDHIDGGWGIDSAVYSGTVSQYSITQNGGTISVTDTVPVRDGSDTLTNVEQVKFSDFTLVFDLASNIDKSIYLLYQAAFDRVPDTSGFRYWAGVADTSNLSAQFVAAQFMAAPEFQQTYGALNNTGFVTALYANVIGRAPDATGLAYWVNNLSLGETRAQMLVDFATSAENSQATAAHMSNGLWTH